MLRSLVGSEMCIRDRVATAYAAQIGTMKVTEQIDAITMLQTDPVEYLVVPRLCAMVVMAPIQCLLFFSIALGNEISLACTEMNCDRREYLINRLSVIKL